MTPSFWQCHEKSDNKEIHISTGHDKLYRCDKISYYLLEHMLTKVYIYMWISEISHIRVNKNINFNYIISFSILSTGTSATAKPSKHTLLLFFEKSKLFDLFICNVGVN